jgi:hypothetical protein
MRMVYGRSAEVTTDDILNFRSESVAIILQETPTTVAAQPDARPRTHICRRDGA